MKLVATIVFFAALLGWLWLEFGATTSSDGVKDILFWVGMGALLVGSYDRLSSRTAKA